MILLQLAITFNLITCWLMDKLCVIMTVSYPDLRVAGPEIHFVV